MHKGLRIRGQVTTQKSWRANRKARTGGKTPAAVRREALAPAGALT